MIRNASATTVPKDGDSAPFWVELLWIMITPIPTRYKGYMFRSRLEARWAVFFDALGVPWLYEKEGYDLGDAGLYLPDFWLETPELGLHQDGIWLEIKPTLLTAEEERKCKALQELTGYEVFAFAGSPELGRFTITSFHEHGIDRDVQLARDYYCCNKYCHGCYDYGRDICGELGMGHVWSNWIQEDDWDSIITHNEIKAALAAARSARFEHGQSGPT